MVSAEDKREDPADAELSRPAENSNGEDGRQKGALRHIATKATRRLLGVLFPHFRLVGFPKIIIAGHRQMGAMLTTSHRNEATRWLPLHRQSLVVSSHIIMLLPGQRSYYLCG